MTSTSFNHFPRHLDAIKVILDQALEACGYNELVIHSGVAHYRFQDDYEFPFKVNPHFAWWVPVVVPNSVLQYRPGQKPRLFYFQPIDYWHLPPADPDAIWADHFEVTQIRQRDEWHDVIADHRQLAVIGDAPELMANFAEAAINPAALLHRLDLGRTVKTPYEQQCIALANQRAARGHQAAARAFAEGASEFATHLAYLQATQHSEQELPYGNIIAHNEHAAVLHYHGLEQSVPSPRHSFLIDAGADHNGYAADITRTYSAQSGGLFNELLSGMDVIQQDIAASARAGVDYRQLHIQTHERIAGLLEATGIVKMAAADQVQSGLSAAFFPHGLGHYLGLQVHDVAGRIADAQGTEIPRPEGHPYLRLTRTLEAGNVLTIEPGVYFIPQLLEPLRQNTAHSAAVNWDLVEQMLPYGGIRIEDNILVKEQGAPRNFSREAFAALD